MGRDRRADCRRAENNLLCCEQKRSKKTLMTGPVSMKPPIPRIKKVFCFFFPKKKSFLFPFASAVSAIIDDAVQYH